MNIITESFDYSSINLEEFDDQMRKMTWVNRSWGDVSAPYLKLYGITYENKNNTIFRLNPPPLYVQCIIKLKKLGLNADPKIFDTSYPVLAHYMELIQNVKLTYLVFLGGNGYQYILNVDYLGKRTDYMWKNKLF